MVIALVLSLFLNLMLVLYLQHDKRLQRSVSAAYESSKSALDNMLSQRDELADVVTGMAHAVAVSLKEIRDDIDANYQHVHYDSTLDQLVGELYRVIGARGEMETGARKVIGILLREDLARTVTAQGGQIHEGDVMDLAQMLEFGWAAHTRAKERAEKLFAVVREPCGEPDHAAWLAKMLAIYERLCRGDVKLAIARLTAVTEAWKHSPSFLAAREASAINA